MSEAASHDSLVLLSTFNVDLLRERTAAAFSRRGLEVDVVAAPFGQVSAQVVDPSSTLYAAAPRYVVIVVAAEDLLAPLFERPSAWTGAQARELVEERVAELGSLVATLLERCPQALCLTVVVPPASAPDAYVLDPADGDRGAAAPQLLLQGLLGIGALDPRSLVVDLRTEPSWLSTPGVHDERLWYLARMRVSPTGLDAVAEAVARRAAAAAHVPRKVAVLDLDGTLWGGVLGEDGLEGIAVGNDGIGLAFRDFQRELLKLSDDGVLLAACSKNDEALALDALERHPDVLLRPSLLAAHRINWQDKAANLRELAAELSLGLDSFVFLDDNPVEREWVRTALPEVLVPELPEDVAARPGFLRRFGGFDRLALTEADLRRSDDYRVAGARRRLESAAVSFEEYLASLEQVVVVEPVSDASLGRAVQLTQRTNQFNLAGRRYDLGSFAELLADPTVEAWTVAVRDRFGDSGITGLAVLRLAGVEAEIDTFLLSCRVLGRQVEDVLLAAVAERARSCGAARLTGLHVPTAKNGQVASFYPARGFVEMSPGRFVLDLAGALPRYPPIIHVEVPTHA